MTRSRKPIIRVSDFSQKTSPSPGHRPTVTFQRQVRVAALGLKPDVAITRRWMEIPLENDRNLQALCDHFRIARGNDMYRSLALELALRLYPTPRRRGATTKWNSLSGPALVVEMERLIDPTNSAKGASWAARQLAKTSHWKSFVGTKTSSATSPNPAEVLRKQYRVFRDRDETAQVRSKYSAFPASRDLIIPWRDFLYFALRGQFEVRP